MIKLNALIAAVEEASKNTSEGKLPLNDPELTKKFVNKLVSSDAPIMVVAPNESGNGHTQRIGPWIPDAFGINTDMRMIYFCKAEWDKFGDGESKVNHLLNFLKQVKKDKAMAQAFEKGQILFVPNSEGAVGVLTRNGENDREQTLRRSLEGIDINTSESQKGRTKKDRSEFMKATSDYRETDNSDGLVSFLASPSTPVHADELVRFLRYMNPVAPKVVIADFEGPILREALKGGFERVISVNNHGSILPEEPWSIMNAVNPGMLEYSMSVEPDDNGKSERFAPVAIKFDNSDVTSLTSAHTALIQKYCENPNDYSGETLSQVAMDNFDPSCMYHVNGSKPTQVVGVYFHSPEEQRRFREELDALHRDDPSSAEQLLIVFCPVRLKENRPHNPATEYLMDGIERNFLLMCCLSPTASIASGAGCGVLCNAYDFGVRNFGAKGIPEHDEQLSNAQHMAAITPSYLNMESTADMRLFLHLVGQNARDFAKLPSHEQVERIQSRIAFFEQQLKKPTYREVVLDQVRSAIVPGHVARHPISDRDRERYFLTRGELGSQVERSRYELSKMRNPNYSSPSTRNGTKIEPGHSLTGY